MHKEMRLGGHIVMAIAIIFPKLAKKPIFRKFLNIFRKKINKKFYKPS